MTEKVEAKLEHIALCANKSCNCLAVGPQDVVSFGCSNSVVLYLSLSCSQQQQVMSYNYHQGRVICTSWMKLIKNGNITCLNYLLSGSTDKTVGLWKYDPNLEKPGKTMKLDLLKVMKGHKDSITGIDSLCIDHLKKYLIVTTSADSTVKIWTGTEVDSIDCSQTFDFKNAFVLDIALHHLPQTSTPVLACAADDFKVKLYVLKCLSKNEIFFEKVLDLGGHEDWVQSVDFVNFDSKSLYLASASQDSFIRLWKITHGNEAVGKELQLKKQSFAICSGKTNHHFSASIDAVLSGHENWVYSVQWHKQSNGDIVLLSSSIDKTVVIWSYDKETEIWVDSVRVGELGGNTLGFYGALFNSAGTYIIANSYSGALHAWRKSKDGFWKAAVTVGGHVASVNDIAWEAQHGRYLVSVSEDQSARLFAKWTKTNTWHEIARPQIHGYDMHCLALVSSTKYVSGADEKVLRVFDASKTFVNSFQTLTGSLVSECLDQVPEGATVPALGLSNKAVLMKDAPLISDRREQYIENLFSPVELNQPPPESYLLQNTLWPETRKVYGHVYELFCVACNRAGTIVASAAKSSQPKHSGIMIWNVETWQQACTLYGHTLTVTQLEFSPNDRFILSVSRDRTWILHKVTDPKEFIFEKVAQSEKKTGHSRIIWSCSWAHDSRCFATASRDKKVLLWSLTTDKTLEVNRAGVLDCKEPVTAVAFSKSSFLCDTYEFAVGLESGTIKIFRLLDDFTFVELLNFGKHYSHCLTVKRLRWKPQSPNDVNSAKSVKWLASCGQDHQVKFFRITIND